MANSSFIHLFIYSILDFPVGILESLASQDITKGKMVGFGHFCVPIELREVYCALGVLINKRE